LVSTSDALRAGDLMSASHPQLAAVPESAVELTRIRVLIADDHPLIIAGVRRTIEHFDDIEVVGEAHSGPEVLQLIERRDPTVVLMDLRMPGINGFDCLEQIRTGWPSLKVVVLSACDERETIDGALRAGANAYVLKSAQPIDIAAVLRQVASGSVFYAPASPPSPDTDADRPGPSLTERERAILEAVASGLTTAAISREMWVSEHTVKFHLTNIYRKLGVANRAGAVRYAIEHRLVAV
jgi:DNA-binding NarL/FixJ family response regulator